MKFFCTALICFVVGVLLAANTPNFEDEFPKFQIGSVEITWTATNYARRDLWTYKNFPQHFPISAISNLIAIGKFTMQDEQNGHKKIADANKHTLLFYSEARLCNLSVIPTQGRIEYWNNFAPANHWDRTNHLWEKVEGLLNESEIEKLGLEFLEQFGIQRSNLTQRADGHLITYGEKKSRGYYDTRTKTNIEDEVTARGIFFKRRINGVDFTGIGLSGGCEIEFGNHAEISDFKLVWPNLQPYKHYNMASADEIMLFIRHGKAVLAQKNRVNLTSVKSITIRDVSPFYRGESGDKKQDFVYPFARVEANVNLGYTNTDITLYCPILGTSKIP